MELPIKAARPAGTGIQHGMFQQKKFDFILDQLIIASNDVKLIFISSRARDWPPTASRENI